MFTPEVCKALGGRYANWHDASAKADADGIDSVIIVGIEVSSHQDHFLDSAEIN